MTDISNNTYWSETDSSNNQASPNGFPEGMNPSGVNDSARATMGAVKRTWDRGNFQITATGAANTYTATFSVTPASYVTGEIFTFISHQANTATATFQVNTLGAKTIKRLDGTTLDANDILSGQLVMVAYNGTDMIVLSPTGNQLFNESNVAITGGTITGITDLAIADGGTGASDAATARTNLGLGTASTVDTGTTSGLVPTLNADGGISLINTDAGALEGPVLDLYRNSASPLADDIMAAIDFSGENSIGTKTVYAKIYTDIVDPADGSEDSGLRFSTIRGGVETDRMELRGGLIIANPTGSDKGTGTINAQVGLYVQGDAVAVPTVVHDWTAGQSGQVTTLTDGANISVNLADSNNFTVTLGGNRTIDNPTNIVAGQSGVITVKQDGTGGRTLAYGTYYKFDENSGTPVITATASAVDDLSYYVVSTTEIHVFASQNWS